MRSSSFKRLLSVNKLHTTRAGSALHDASSRSTVNQDEIAHFSRLSSGWWDERGHSKLLHRMNPIRMRFIRDKLTEVALEEQGEHLDKAVFDGLEVLDVGCGGGLLSESLARVGAKVLGIDASASNIAIATSHASTDPQLSPSLSPSPTRRRCGRLEYLHTSAECLLKEDKRFDVVCSMEVLEHVDHPATFLSTCSELVKPGGHLFLSTIARTPLAYFLTILMAEQLLREVPLGTHTHSKYINPSELIAFFQKYPAPRTLTSSADTEAVHTSRPWITTTDEHGLPTRREAEVRGMAYIPWNGQWKLFPRQATAWGGAECNYIFWVRKPADT